MTVIGSAYVNIRAITDKLESDIRSSLESITDSIGIHVDADVSSATAKLETLTDSIKEQTITVHADTSEAITELQNVANLSHLQNQTIQVDADTLAARSEIDNMMDDIDGARPNITPDVDTTLAEARLAVLTRFRDMRINLKMNSGPLVMAGNAIARMSGARVIVGDLQRMSTHFINIDKAVPGIAKAAILIGSIGSLALSSVGGLLTLGASLGSIISMVGIAAPGMATGFIVGIGTLMIALKDFSKQLPAVAAQWKTLGNTIKSNFWDVAREPLRDMANNLFPHFQKGLKGTATALGGWASAVGASIDHALTGNGAITSMFGNLNASIEMATGGSALMANSLIHIGNAGSAVLPRLAGWFTDVSTQFNEFITKASLDGSLNRWIDEGIIELKRLGSLIGEVSGFFGGMTQAARNAGSDGLGTLLDVFTRLNDAVNSPEGMKSMTQIFQGANAVTATFGDALMDIFGALGNAAPAIKSSLESVSSVVGFLGDAISKIISDPAFQEGFAAMFAGIAEGAGKLLPVVGEMGPKMGAFLSIIGSLAANIGGVLGAALEVALPLITALKEAIDPLIPIIGDALIRAIESLAPTFDIFAKSLKDVGPPIADAVKFIADLVVGLVDTLGPALPGITAAVLAFMAGMKLGSIIMTVVNGVKNLITFITLLRSGTALAAAGQIAFNTALLANPIGLVIGAVAALVAGFVIAYNNVGWFKDFVNQSMGMISDAIGHLVNFWNDSVVPMWNDAMSAAGEFFGAIGAWVGDAIKAVQDFFGGFGKGAGDAGNAVGGFFAGIGQGIADFVAGVGGWFDGIGKGIGDAFNGAVGFVTDVINNISAVVTPVVEGIVSFWTTAWQGISDVFTNIWNGIVWFFQPMIDLIAAIITGTLDIIVALWTATWEIIGTIFYGIWINIQRFFEPILQGIADFITNTVNGIVSVWNAVWQGILDFFNMIWTNMVAFYGPILQSIWDFIVAVGAGIAATWNSVWQGILDFFNTIWANMVAFYGPILQSIWDFIVAVGAGIAATWNAIWQGISDFFTGVWNAIVGFVQGAVQNVSNVISNVVNGISAMWNATWSAISSYVSQVWSGIVSAVSGFVSSVQQNVQNVLTSIGKIGSDIVNNVSNFGTLLVNSGRDLINGLVNGINNASGAVVEKIKEIAGGALDAIKNFFGIKSPSRVMRDQVGKQIGAGLAIGIEASIGAVLKATDKLAAAAVPEIADIMLPAVKTASGASQRGTTSAVASPALSRETVIPSRGAQTASSVFGSMGETAPVVNFNVQTTPGLDEVQVGESAMNYMYWKLNTSNLG